MLVLLRPLMQHFVTAPSAKGLSQATAIITHLPELAKIHPRKIGSVKLHIPADMHLSCDPQCARRRSSRRNSKISMFSARMSDGRCFSKFIHEGNSRRQ